MKRGIVRIACLFMFTALLIGRPEMVRVNSVTPVLAAAPALAAGLTPLAPTGCPAGGCAAGQRLSYRLDLEVGAYTPAATPNVKVCVYIPTPWLDPGSVQLDTTGGITGAGYSASGNCAEDPAPPAGYSLAADGAAALNDFYFSDTLNLSFRIARTASSSGSVLMRLFEQNGGVWTRTAQVFTNQMPVVPRTTTVYVAADASGCGGQQPCYLNSSGDQAGALGTGMRDALDALDETQSGLRLVVLGTVGLKSTPLTINKSVSIEGSGDATLTASGSTCSAAAEMLRFTAGGALRGLNLNDGSCSAANNRPLVVVDSPADVLIESNDLTGGADAIRVTGSQAGSVTVRYNQIRGNSGYALYWDNSSNAALTLVANNLDGNRSGDPVECAAGASAAVSNRQANHNYWGGQAPGSGTHCAAQSGKQLGAPVQALTGAPGLDARRVTVTTSKTYAFNNQIAYARSGGSDFDLYVVNHGASFPDAQPFPALGPMPMPCGNTWDVFLASAAPADAVLDLSLRYDRSAACIAAVETSSYCEQSTAPQNYPLWWIDPLNSVTSGWDTTGQKPAGTSAGGANGQATSCDMTAHEIKVSVDTSGRPDLVNDLNYTPLLVGIPIPATWQAFASDRTVTLLWTTTHEPDITGFTVLRSQTAGGPFEPVSDLIARKGSATGPGSYSYVDGGRTNGVTSYYVLRVTRADGGILLSNVISIASNIPTLTYTPTVTPTRTPTATLTLFRLPSTAAPLPTRAFTATRALATAARTATPTFGRGTPSLTFGRGTPSPTLPGGYPPPDGDLTPLATQPDGYPGPAVSETAATGEAAQTATPEPGTPTVTETPSRTPAPTLSRAEQIRGASRYISLVMGLLISATVVAGLTWLLFRRRAE
jgi:hypothetical protein